MAELTRSSAPSLDIPKELFQLVDHLKKYGLDEVFVCLSVCLFVYLYVCLFVVCLFVCLSVCCPFVMSACLYSCLFVCLLSVCCLSSVGEPL